MTGAIWILDQTLFVERPEYAHRYCLRDDQGRRLVDHGVIRLFELSKFQVTQVETDAERWLKFLKDGEQLDPEHLPEWMQDPIMRHAMSTLSRFSEKERDYHRYQSRQEALRVQRSIQRALDEARVATETARADEQAARAAAEAARAATEAERAATEAERMAKEEARAATEAERMAKEEARAAMEAERMAKEEARAAMEAALQDKESALAEIARLKALLQQQKNG